MSRLVPFSLFYLIESINTTVYRISTQDFSGLILACFILALIAVYIYEMGKWNSKCPRCAERGITVYVLPGNHCRICNQPC